jgi:hypothetical protein
LYTLYTGNPTLAGNVTITGTLTVNGTTTTINSTTLSVDDKLIEIGAVASPTNTTADGGGVSLFGATNKTILWDNANANWTTSENWNLASTKTLKIDNVAIASGTGAALVLGANASTSLALGNASGTTTINGTVNIPNTFQLAGTGVTTTATKLNYLTSATGTTGTTSTNVVFSTSPTLTTPTIDTINVAGSGSTAALWNTTLTTGSISMGGALTTGVVNIATGTSFTSATGGQAAINIGTGAHTATTKTVNIGGAGVGGTLAVNIGSATGTSTTTVNGTFKVGASTLAAGVSGTVTLPSTAGTLMDNKMTTIGDILYASATGTPATYTRLAGVTATAPGFLYSVGNGTANTSTAFSSSTGSGNVVLATSATITTPTIDTINTSLTASGTAALWNTGLTTGTISIGGALTTGTVNIASGTAGAKTINIGTSTGTTTIAGTVINSGDGVILKTASFTVGAGERNYNVTGTATVTVTLPTATAGRTINIVNKAAFTIVSASSNVYPRTNNTLGTAITSAAVGSWATLVADGTNWYIIAGA